MGPWGRVVKSSGSTGSVTGTVDLENYIFDLPVLKSRQYFYPKCPSDTANFLHEWEEGVGEQPTWWPGRKEELNTSPDLSGEIKDTKGTG